MDKELTEQEKAFKLLCESAENYIKEYGNPHTTIIIQLDSIEVLQGVQAKSFVIED